MPVTVVIMFNAQHESPRLWGMACCKKYPLTQDLVQAARKKGIVKTSAADILERRLAKFDHKVMLQRMMDQTVQGYAAPCRVHGACQTSTMLRKQSQLLHRAMMQAIKQQLKDRLPSAVVKDALISGDIAVAIRLPEEYASGGSTSSSSSDVSPPSLVQTKTCMVFLLPKVVLRPEYAIFLEMEVDFRKYTASLAVGPESFFAFKRSFDMAVELLSLSPASLWLNVLSYKPLYFGRRMGGAELIESESECVLPLQKLKHACWLPAYVGMYLPCNCESQSHCHCAVIRVLVQDSLQRLFTVSLSVSKRNNNEASQPTANNVSNQSVMFKLALQPRSPHSIEFEALPKRSPEFAVSQGSTV